MRHLYRLLVGLSIPVAALTILWLIEEGLRRIVIYPWIVCIPIVAFAYLIGTVILGN